MFEVHIAVLMTDYSIYSVKKIFDLRVFMYDTQPMYQARNQVRSSDIPTLVVVSSAYVINGTPKSVISIFRKNR